MTMIDTGGLGVAVTSGDGRGVAPLITAIEDPIVPESKCSVWGWPQLHSTPRHHADYLIVTVLNNLCFCRGSNRWELRTLHAASDQE